MNGHQRPRYAYLGPRGTFTEAALRQVVDPGEAEYLPQVDVVTAIEAVRTGEADRAVVAIENSVEGGVTAVLDTLAVGEPLVILQEMLVPVSFVLAARPGTRLDDVVGLSAHPHAWAQCRRWLRTNLPDVVHVPATSNTAPAQLLADTTERLAFEAALIPPTALEHYRLDVLAQEVADSGTAVTRFVLIGPPGSLPAPTGTDKTTLVVHLPSERPGALLEMLEQFSTRGINLSRIESRPLGDSLGRYSFSIDCEGHIAEERVADALMGLHRMCPHVRFLGSYPRVDAGGGRGARPGTSDADYHAAREWVMGLREGGAI